MIVQDILNKFVWTPYGITCPDYQSMRLAHKFLREAILDRHLYVCKVIGFDISTSSMSRAHAGTYIARHRQLGDSYPEIMLNLSDKLFMTSANSDVSIDLNSGENTVSNVVFNDVNQNAVETLSVRDEICRVIDKSCVMRLKVVYDCGYRSCQQNSKKIGTDYFPCYTDFYTGEFFRVLPPEEGNIVVIRYYNGATPETLRRLLEMYFNTIQAGGLRKKEREWLHSFMQ